MSDCPRCDWRNPYRTSQDGSREWESAEHQRDHEATDRIVAHVKGGAA